KAAVIYAQGIGQPVAATFEGRDAVVVIPAASIRWAEHQRQQHPTLWRPGAVHQGQQLAGRAVLLGSPAAGSPMRPGVRTQHFWRPWQNQLSGHSSFSPWRNARIGANA